MAEKTDRLTQRGLRRKVKAKVGSISRTKQSMAAACDINNIMAQYRKTGVLPPDVREAMYGDFSNVDDYKTAVDRVNAAQELFDGLPSKIRNYCRNNPAELLALVFDADRVDEMREIGLLPPEEERPIPKPSESAPEEKSVEPGQGEA